MDSIQTEARTREEMQEKTRKMLKAYLEAPIDTRHLAAGKAAADYESALRELRLHRPPNSSNAV